MAFDTLRTNKMRSALTVLGVVIGITSIVGMTSLIRGFDKSLRDSISQLGPNTIIVQKFGALSFASGTSFLEVARRPEPHDGRRAGDRARVPVDALVDVWLGAGGQQQRSRVFYGNERTQAAGDPRHDRELGRGQLRQARARAGSSSRRKSSTAAASCVLGNGPSRRCSRSIDPIGKKVRIGSNEFTVIGVLGKRPSPGGFSTERRRLRDHPVHAPTRSSTARC